MIDVIYASKLYKASKRKSAIVAAANDPVNTELVTQLADALSPVYKKEEYLVDKEAEAEKAKAREAREAKESMKPDASANDSTSRSEHSPSHLSESFRKAAKHEAEAQKAEQSRQIRQEEREGTPRHRADEQREHRKSEEKAA